jgi:dihydrofolate synthase/folylpolyglutamate synthase
MILEEWLMQKFGAEKFAPGLERVRSFVAPYLLEIQRQKPLIITVAGTNGKGQTAMSLARHLKHNQKSFALWTSPHIERVTERFVAQTGEIDRALLQQLLEFEAARAKAQSVGLSYYEILWAAFLRWVTLEPREFLVLEVGLGGRLDAVNLLDAQVVALTSISRDHQEYLGSRYELILQEKLGVLRKGASLFSTLETTYLNERAERHSKELGYRWMNLSSQISSQSDFWERNEFLSRSIIQSFKLSSAPAPAEDFLPPASLNALPKPIAAPAIAPATVAALPPFSGSALFSSD